MITKMRNTIAAAVILLMGSMVLPAEAQQTGTLTPTPYQTVLNSSGAPISGGCIWTYVAGTSTPAATYTTKAATVQNANPIQADASGQFVAYLLAGQSYKFVYETACIAPAHGAVLRTQDGIDAVPAVAVNLDVTGVAGEALTAGQAVYLSDGSGAKAAGQWFKADSANTYSSSAAVSVGMVPASIVSAATGTIRLSGSMTGLSALTPGLTYYIGTGGALTSTRPSNWRVLGAADSTTSLILEPAPASMVQWTVVTTVSTGTQNDFAPGLIGNTIIRANNATLLTLNGLAGGYDGQRVIVEGVGGGEVDIAPQNAGSAAANRFIAYLSGSNTIIPAAGGSAEAVYDGTTARWRLVSLNSATTTGLTVLAGSTAGTQNNWAPGITGNTTFVMASATDLTVTGIAGGYSGLTVTFINSGAGGNLYFKHLNGGSSAANQLTNAATSGDTPVAAGGWITYVHNGTNWKLFNHEQGAWITPTFNSGTYVASAGNWTVIAGNVTTQAFKLQGRTVTAAWALSATSVTSTPTTLQINNTAWGNFTISGRAILNTIVYNDNGGGNTVGFAQVQSGGVWIPITKLTGSFAVSVGATNVFGEVTFEVQD